MRVVRGVVRRVVHGRPRRCRLLRLVEPEQLLDGERGALVQRRSRAVCAVRRHPGERAAHPAQAPVRVGRRRVGQVHRHRLLAVGLKIVQLSVRIVLLLQLLS